MGVVWWLKVWLKMASNEKEDSKDNPFSFKSFVSKRQGGGIEQKRKEGKKKTADAVSSSSSSGAPAPKATSLGSLPPPGSVTSGDNPFSFKNFIKKADTAQKTGSDDESPFSSEDEMTSSEVKKISLPLLPPDPAPVVPGTKKKSKSIKPASEPMKDLFSSSSDEDLPPSNLSRLPLSDPLVLPFGDDKTQGEDEADEVEEEGILNINPFPEAVMLAPDETQQNLLSELNKFKSENESLRKQIADLEKSLKKEKAKSQSLKDEVRLLKEKEAKDTKALDDMVQKIEENLKIATQRSVTADATITKLKVQVTSLQTQLAQANPQAIHKSYEDLIIGVREKANNASQQLKAAAYKADLQIKELCHGVEALKLVSDTLENIDSIFEVKK